MKAFYILKPDCLSRREVIDFYKNYIDSLNFIKNREQYLINSWVDLSKKMYDPIDKKITKKDKEMIRRQLLTTIKGYDIIYPNDLAIIDIFDVIESENSLKELEKFKYLLREKYVLNTPKNYLKFLNLDKFDLSIELENINIKELEVIHKKVNYDEDIIEQGYNLAYLNCIHFPDPTIDCINKDLDIIESKKILTKKINL